MSTGANGIRLLIAGGGTGGHLFPGLAVAEALRAKSPAHEVLFVGTERGIEARVCPREGLKLRTIQVQRLKGGGLGGWAAGLLALPRAILQSWRVLRDEAPTVVLGVGGYASGPAVLAAVVRGLPTLILEPNARPGFTNRVLGLLVRKVVIALEDARRFFPAARTLLLGNPVRQAIRAQLDAARQAAAPRQAGEPAHVLVVGGSQGARGINRIVPAAVQALLQRGAAVQVRHQTGRLDAASVRVDVEGRGLTGRVQLEEFIEDMAGAYAWADLVVCRAGATTVSELAVARRPAVLIPFPHAADNHQEANARALVQAGAARMVREAELTPSSLAELLQELLQDRGALDAMGEAAGKVARAEAAEAVVELVLELARPAGGRGTLARRTSTAPARARTRIPTDGAAAAGTAGGGGPAAGPEDET